MVDELRSSPPPESSNKTNTRLIKILQSLQAKLGSRLKELKTGLLVKVLFFLVGFYCATAFATVIGQTGDWDILSAGLAVVVVESIGALMYKASTKFFDRIRGLITMFNYWKAGLSLGNVLGLIESNTTPIRSMSSVSLTH
ncbi:Ycf20-like protein [Apostasia shenzhenica]|uniref:Ycf20-like protein n=1 Tax=Apostasia shenzhenica TaxID=1088818 RepID=A0A2I0B4Y9_9ASPA|nr:Ycf20-like protein [Apostasia shenzhenica]